MSDELVSAVQPAVANPPTILFIPPQLFGLNVAVNMALMMISLVTLDMNPLLFIVSLIGIHIFLIVATNKDLHLFTILKAAGTQKNNTKNIIKSEHAKYVP